MLSIRKEMCKVQQHEPFLRGVQECKKQVQIGKSKGITFYVVLLDQMVSVVLHNLTPGRGPTQPWCELEVIRADGQRTSHAGLAPSICPPYVFASPNFTPWYGGASQ